MIHLATKIQIVDLIGFYGQDRLPNMAVSNDFITQIKRSSGWREVK